MSLRILALGLVAVALVVVPTPGAAAVRQLERAAKEWESRGREDKAAEAWERILGLQANHPDALRGVGLARAAEGRTAEAERYLRRLEQAAPQHEGVGQIRQRLALGPRHRSLLTDARLHAQTGRKAEALETYRQLFGPAPPPPALALEYYRTVGGDEEGWEEARRGLEATVRRWPSPRHRLALAEHLTYRPETREQGVAMLRELVDDDDVGPSAKSAWRQSLDWLGASPGELAMIAAYEERYPEDGPVRSAPAEGQARGGSGSGVDRALLAQGLQALEEGRFTDAIGIFERVRRSAPDEPAVWARPLRSARFWDGMQRAQAARAEGNRERAREILVEIQAISRPEAAHAELVLAQIDQEEGELARAEARLLPLLGNPEVQIPALETLIGILAQMGREEEARQRQAELAALDEERALDPRWEAELLRHRARTAMDAGDLEEAQAVLERAHTLDPNHVWVLHDLSTVALQQGRMEEANTWAAKLAARDPDLPEARLLSARILVAEGDPEGALAVLAPLEDDPAVARERHHIALLAELGRAQALYGEGRRASGAAIPAALAGRGPHGSRASRPGGAELVATRGARTRRPFDRRRHGPRGASLPATSVSALRRFTCKAAGARRRCRWSGSWSPSRCLRRIERGCATCASVTRSSAATSFVGTAASPPPSGRSSRRFASTPTNPSSSLPWDESFTTMATSRRPTRAIGLRFVSGLRSWKRVRAPSRPRRS